MKLVVVSDLHLVPDGAASPGTRRGDLGLHLLSRLVIRLNRFVKPDFVALLGDVVDDGGAPDAADLWRQTKDLLDTLACPYLALPGNHDGDERQFQRLFGDVPPVVDVAGVRFLTFLDAPAPHWNATRSAEDMARSRAAATNWSGPVVALQHVPVLPDGGHPCTFNLTNAEEALAALADGGVHLAVAGHYHRGVPLLSDDRLQFSVAPALCEAPFQFLEIDIEARRPPRAASRQLAMPEGLQLSESHVHSQLAYCADDVAIEPAIALCRDLGVQTPAVVEHSGQLYFDRETFWSAGFMREGLAGTHGRVERMDDFFRLATAAGLPRRQIGLEVDCDFSGRPVLRDEDRKRAGFLLGAIHWTPYSAAKGDYQADLLARQHKALWHAFLASGIAVLAHPFRIFNRYGQAPPETLFETLVDLLVQHGVAAEINFHIQEPNRQFTRMCLDKGVKLALGSDSHTLAEVADFWPHLDFLAALGVADGDLPDILWHP